MRQKTTLVMVATTLILAAGSWASAETVLYSFGGYSGDGYSPYSALVADAEGNLYGTTFSGGTGYGTVFELELSGGNYSEVLLHTFVGGATDGEYPQDGALVFDKAGNLYGVTYEGGTAGAGTVFEMSLSGGIWTETLLHSFAGFPKDAGYPLAPLSFDKAGHLFGTTYYGGAHNVGAVFEMTESKGKWTCKVIHSFSEGNGGSYPLGGLVLGKDGDYYGTTSEGGFTYNAGTVYRLSEASGAWVSQTVYVFSGGKSGTYPYAGLSMDAAGNFYGTTYEGGTADFGTVYELTLGENDKYTHHVLHSFQGGDSDGSYPYYEGVIVDAKGNLYGTTYQGGSTSDGGCVYELKLTSGKYEEVILHAFGSSGDGAYPRAGVILVNGKLMGTTSAGGAHGVGTVFEVAP